MYIHRCAGIRPMGSRRVRTVSGRTQLLPRCGPRYRGWGRGAVAAERLGRPRRVRRRLGRFATSRYHIGRHNNNSPLAGQKQLLLRRYTAILCVDSSEETNNSSFLCGRRGKVRPLRPHCETTGTRKCAQQNLKRELRRRRRESRLMPPLPTQALNRYDHNNCINRYIRLGDTCVLVEEVTA